MYEKIKDMAYRDFIAVIDLGTSRLIGMVGQKDSATGVISVLAFDEEETDHAIRRGIIFNIEKTAERIKRLVAKLEAKLKGGKIVKVYVGIGGQSLHSMDYSVVKEVAEEAVMTEEIKAFLLEDCRTFQPKGLVVYDIVSPTYYINDKLEQNPVGVPYSKIEAHYKLIVGRPAIRRHIENTIERVGLELAGILISPLALSDVVFSEDEKKLGCALVDFGAGVTSVTVMKGGKLDKLAVIPLGNDLITKDLTTLHLVESEAERIKLEYGNAVADLETEEAIRVNSVDGVGIRELKLADVHYVIESRVKEILENVFAQLGAEDSLRGLGAGVVITGGGADLRGLMEIMHKQLKMDIRWASLRSGLQKENMAVSVPEYYVALGLLSQGTVNCAYVPPVAPQTEPVSLFPEEEEEAEEIQKPPQPKEPKDTPKPSKDKPSKEKAPKEKGKFGSLFDKIGGLFDEVDKK